MEGGGAVTRENLREYGPAESVVREYRINHPACPGIQTEEGRECFLVSPWPCLPWHYTSSIFRYTHSLGTGLISLAHPVTLLVHPPPTLLATPHPTSANQRCHAAMWRKEREKEEEKKREKKTCLFSQHTTDKIIARGLSKQLPQLS